MCLKTTIQPDLDMYNLLLRATKDCNTDPKNIENNINYQILNLKTGSIMSKKPTETNLSDQNQELDTYNKITNYETFLVQIDKRNLNKKIKMLPKNMDTPSGRFNFIGGVEGVCKSMSLHQIKPDSKTVNTMLRVRFNNSLSINY